ITDVVKRTARRLVHADGAAFVLRDNEQCYYVGEEAMSPLWKGRRFPLTACISGGAMLHRQPVIMPDIYEDPRIPHEVYRPTFVKSLVMTPIRTLQPWAAIGVYWSERYDLEPEEAGWLQALADSTAVAMENVRARDQLRSSHNGTTRQQTSVELVRMCAWTKRISLDGEWGTIEAFLERRFGLEVTHTVSGEALAALMDGLPAGRRAGRRMLSAWRRLSSRSGRASKE